MYEKLSELISYLSLYYIWEKKRKPSINIRGTPAVRHWWDEVFCSLWKQPGQGRALPPFSLHTVPCNVKLKKWSTLHNDFLIDSCSLLFNALLNSNMFFFVGHYRNRFRNTNNNVNNNNPLSFNWPCWVVLLIIVLFLNLFWILGTLALKMDNIHVSCFDFSCHSNCT